MTKALRRFNGPVPCRKIARRSQIVLALLIPAAPLALSACGVASAAGKVVTAPVKVVSKGVDLATTSQSEADEKRGREMRKREQRLGLLTRKRDELRDDCYGSRGAKACDELRRVEAEIYNLNYGY